MEEGRGDSDGGFLNALLPCTSGRRDVIPYSPVGLGSPGKGKALGGEAKGRRREGEKSGRGIGKERYQGQEGEEE